MLFNKIRLQRTLINFSSKQRQSFNEGNDDVDIDIAADFPEFEKIKEELEKEYKNNPEFGPNDILEKGTDYSRVIPKQEWQNKQFQEWKSKNQEKTLEKTKNILTYDALYRDARGEEKIKVHLRGDKVCIILNKQFQYSGDDFHCLSTPAGIHKIVIDTYTIFQHSQEGYLTQFSLIFDIPIHIIKHQELAKAKLTIQIQVDHKQEDPQKNKLILTVNNKKFESAVTDTINLALSSLVSKLPKSIILKSCWSCAWSNYNPYSRSNFGGLGCFVGKEEMFDKKNSKGIFHMWNELDRDVQEHYLCEKWVQRTTKHRMPEKEEMKEQQKITYDFE